MRHGSLFSGIGGFDLAAEWMGWENVFHCENNLFCQKILKHYWPNAKSYGDIDDANFNVHRRMLDVLTGGFPCQPYSTAGKREGNKDNRHKWPQMLRAAREIQAPWIVPENVRGLINWSDGLVFDEVQADLEAESYEVFPVLLPACAVDAPHRRDRIWIIAYSSSYGQQRADTIKEINNRQSAKRMEEGHESYPLHGNGDVANTNGIERCKGGMHEAEQKEAERYTSTFDSRNIRNTWKNFPTQSPVCGGNDGIPNRVDRIKALGNAIVPQVAYEIFKAIEQYEKDLCRHITHDSNH